MLRFRPSCEGALAHLLDFIICFALLCSLLIVGPPQSLAAQSLQDHPSAPNCPNLDEVRHKQWPKLDLKSQALLVWVGQQPHKADSPEEVTRKFYNWYFSANFPNPKRSNMATFRKYVTQSFLKRATAPDVESLLFIDAQDTDSTWATNFTVSNATMHSQRATVQVALNGKEMKYNLLVTLKREGGVWKIDDVKGSET